MWAPRTLVITDRRRLGAHDDGAFVAFVGAVAAAGVDAVQLRERDLDDGRLLVLTRSACAAVAGTSCRVLVNERAHVAWAAGAHGVHLRSDGMPPRRVRLVQPGPGLIGRSVHEGDAVEVADGADYVLFGTVFPSASKPATAPVAGLAALGRWSGQPGAPPVVAVGGITLAGCAEVREAGASGVAGIELFAAAYSRGQHVLDTLVRDIHAVFADGERAE